jgi:hypothetical protein
VRALDKGEFQVRHGETDALPGRTARAKTMVVEIPEGHRRRTADVNPATRSLPMPATGLAAVQGWSLAAAAVMTLASRWEPGRCSGAAADPMPPDRFQAPASST